MKEINNQYKWNIKKRPMNKLETKLIGAILIIGLLTIAVGAFATSKAIIVIGIGIQVSLAIPKIRKFYISK